MSLMYFYCAMQSLSQRPVHPSGQAVSKLDIWKILKPSLCGWVFIQASKKIHGTGILSSAFMTQNTANINPHI